MAFRHQRALLLRLRHQTGVLLRRLLVDHGLRLQVAPLGQRLDGDPILHLRLLRFTSGRKAGAGAQRGEHGKAF